MILPDRPAIARLGTESEDDVKSSCDLHMFCAKPRYVSCHIGCIGGNVWEAKLAPHQTVGY